MTSRIRSLTVVFALALVCCAAPAGAKTYEVTRKSDPAPGKCKPNDCSLREAVLAANAHAGADAIVLPDRQGAYNLTRSNGNPVTSESAGLLGDLDATGPLAIRHPGRGVATIDANGHDRVIEIFAGKLRLKKLKLRGGEALYTPGEEPRLRRGTSTHGGAVFAHGSARIAISRSVIARNSAERGAVEDEFPPGFGTTVKRSRIVNNNASGLNGNVNLKRSTVSGNDGIGVISYSGIKVDRSTIAGNGRSGIYTSNGGRITNTTISKNESSGIEHTGGTDPLRVTNTTIARNVGIYGGGIFAADGTILLNSVTIADNSVAPGSFGDGGGILVGSDGSVGIINTILVRNKHKGVLDDCVNDFGGNFDSDGGNLITSEGSCTSFEPGFGDYLRSNPKLAAQLKRNGGPTQTLVLKRGSPAIGKAVKAAAPNRDQRGRKRDNKPDIGAFER